jgi:hypothetical protein
MQINFGKTPQYQLSRKYNQLFSSHVRTDGHTDIVKVTGKFLKCSGNGVLYLGEIGFLGIVHNDVKNTTFRKLDLFPSSPKIMEALTLLGPSERAKIEVSYFYNGSNRVGVPIILPDDGNRSSFRNVVCFRTQNDRQSPKANFSPVHFSLLLVMSASTDIY